MDPEAAAAAERSACVMFWQHPPGEDTRYGATSGRGIGMVGTSIYSWGIDVVGICSVHIW